MLYQTVVLLKTNQSRALTRARLAAVVVTPPSLRSLKPIRISDWLAQYEGKVFVGRLDVDRFKLSLLNTPMAGVQWRGNTIVIVGAIDDEGVRAVFRPPIFTLVFSFLIAVVLAGAFVLSFYGPSNTPMVHGLLATGFVLPPTVVGWMFVREARAAEQVLRTVIGAIS